MDMDKGTNSYRKWYTIIFVLMPLMDQYLLCSLTNFELFSLISVIIHLIRKKMVVSCNKTSYPFVFMMMYGLILAVLNAFVLDISIRILILRVLSAIVVLVNVFFVASETFDYKLGSKCYITLCVILAIGLFVQYVYHLLTSSYLYLLIPGATLNYMDGMSTSYYTTHFLQLWYYRPASFFIEPAHFSTFCLPAILLCFNKDDVERKDYIIAAFISASVLLTTSTVGLICVLFIWLSVFGKTIIKMKVTKKQLAFMVIIIVGFFIILNNKGVIASFNQKLNSMIQVVNNTDEGSSLSVRLLGGIQYYSQLPFAFKIIGTGYGNLVAFITAFNMNSVYGIVGSQSAYMNGISQILCSFGIIGIGLFLFFIWGLYRKSVNQERVLLMVLILVMIGTENFTTPVVYLYLLLQGGILAVNINGK